GGQFVERRIFHGEIAVPHTAARAYDGVARHAADAGLRFRRVDLVLDRAVETPVEEDRVIVTSRAPLAGARPHDVLHVLNRFSVELIVERGKVVHGTLPLLVDILMAGAAGLRVHEEVRRNDGAGIGLRRRWRKGRERARALLVHGGRRGERILYAVVRIG